MKKYPSITNVLYKHNAYVFNKLDGCNVRAEWSPKRGFYKFGSRRRLVGRDDEIFGRVYDLIPSKYEELEKIAKKNRWKKAVFFFELYGPSSFAGQHHPDEELTVTLIDVAVDNKGILLPKTFLKIFQDKVEIPDLLYQGKIDGALVHKIRSGNLEGMSLEGVVCKANQYESPGLPFMWKIKTNEWLEMVRELCGDDEDLFKKIS